MAAAEASSAESGQDSAPLLTPRTVGSDLVLRRRLLLRLAGAAALSAAFAGGAALLSRSQGLGAARTHQGAEQALSIKEQYPSYTSQTYAQPAAAPAYTATYAPAPTYAPATYAPASTPPAYLPVPAPSPPAYPAAPAAPPATYGGGGGGTGGAFNPQSIYCFALVVPGGSEVKLLEYQMASRISLFACDAYQVFSNVSFTLGVERLPVIPIGMSLECTHGGRWGTALNTDVFVQLWKVVAQQGRWRSHGWSAKLDADAVFLPDRLRGLLRSMPNPGRKYLNNCKWGMHGPIEVVAHDALATFFSQMDMCEQIRSDAMVWQPVHWNEKMQRWTGTDKDHSFGEDQYLRRCFRQLGITVVNKYELLDELACGGDPKHTGCVGNYVTYHPFKSVDEYRTCLAYAQSESTQTMR